MTTERNQGTLSTPLLVISLGLVLRLQNSKCLRMTTARMRLWDREKWKYKGDSSLGRQESWSLPLTLASSHERILDREPSLLVCWYDVSNEWQTSGKYLADYIYPDWDTDVFHRQDILENISSTEQDPVVELPGSRALSLLKIDLFKVCDALVIC